MEIIYSFQSELFGVEGWDESCGCEAGVLSGGVSGPCSGSDLSAPLSAHRSQPTLRGERPACVLGSHWCKSCSRPHQPSPRHSPEEYKSILANILLTLIYKANSCFKETSKWQWWTVNSEQDTDCQQESRDITQHGIILVSRYMDICLSDCCCNIAHP